MESQVLQRRLPSAAQTSARLGGLTAVRSYARFHFHTPALLSRFVDAPGLILRVWNGNRSLWELLIPPNETQGFVKTRRSGAFGFLICADKMEEVAEGQRLGILAV